MSRLSSSKKRYRAFRTNDGSADASLPGNEENCVDRATRRRYLREYRKWLWPFRGTLVVVFIMAMVSAGMALILPLATKYIIDDVLPAATASPEKVGHLLSVILVIAGVLLLAQGIDTGRQYLMAKLNAQVIFRLRQKLFDRFLRLPLGDLAELKSGGIVSRLSQDVDKVTGMVQMALITPGVATLRVILTVIVLFFLSWQMALMAAALIPPIVLINLIWVRKVRPVYRSMAEERADVDGRVTETFSGLRVVRAFRRERKEERDYAVAHHTIIRKKLLAEKLRLVVIGGWGLLIPITSLAIVGLGGYLVIEGKGTIGDIIAFQMFAFMLLQPVSQIVNSLSATQQGFAALERVFEILERPEEKPDPPHAMDTPSPIEEIRFDQVCFAYREGIQVLSYLSLAVPAGSTVALVGPSGGGKSTLTDLIARFYDPTSGGIEINGIDLRDIRLADYRERLAIVPQEVFLFDGTVRENIAYGRRGSVDGEVVDAAQRANAHEFIERLPEGYDTLIGERGVKLSGGQRQRLSIARAILADPEILILDEATSNLDTESEQLIQVSLADLLSTRTTFVIAHRLSTINNADIIVVMSRGRIVETGTHAELMSEDTLYRDMVERQRRFAVDESCALEWD